MSYLNHHLLLFFAPGTGGNHLANLLALSDKYHRQTEYDLYDAPPVDGWAAHFGYTNTVSNIQMYHFGAADDEKIKRFDNRADTIRLMIHLPENNKFALQRFKYWCGLEAVEIRRMTHLLYDMVKIYKQHNLQRFYPGRWETIFADDLFDETKTEQLLDMLEFKTECKLDRDKAREIHSKWLYACWASLPANYRDFA